MELRLSDAFETPDNSDRFEWTATMFNINIEHGYFDGFFRRHKEGIILSCLTEFNEEIYQKDGIIKVITMLKNVNAAKNIVVIQLIEQSSLSKEDAIELVNTYWES